MFKKHFIIKLLLKNLYIIKSIKCNQELRLIYFLIYDEIWSNYRNITKNILK